MSATDAQDEASNANQESDGMVVQSLIFAKEKFATAEAAQKWIADHEGFADNGVDETEDSFRFRQSDPENFDADSFRTIDIDDGVKAVVGKLKADEDTADVEAEPAVAVASISAMKHTSHALRLSRNPDAMSETGLPLYWEHVATEGDFLGYRNGADPFSLTRAHFDQIVQNLHNHPSYRAGSNGVGCAPVVPWDFDHASAKCASEGSIPVTGVPAQGWTYEFNVRTGTNGVTELWALTQFLEPAASYIRDGRYRWASLVCDLEAVEPRSGASVGAVVVSIAMTNTPFIEGMVPLAASRPRHLGSIVKKPEETMSELIKKLAAVYSCEATEEAVLTASETLLAKTEADAEAVATVTSEADQIKARMTALLSALGVENPGDAIARVVSLLEQASQLQTLLPELDKLREAAKKQADEDAAADVDAVMAARQLPSETRTALILFRSQQPEQFANTYPKRTAETRHVLARDVAASEPVASVSQAHVLDLDKYAGRNRMEQAIEYVKSTNPSSKDWDWDSICLAAQKALRLAAAR